MVAKSEVKDDEQGQFVELPPGLEFPDDVTDVEITVVGDARLITPIQKRSTKGELAKRGKP